MGGSCTDTAGTPGLGAPLHHCQQPGSVLPCCLPGSVLLELGCICPVRGVSCWSGSSGASTAQPRHSAGSNPARSCAGRREAASAGGLAAGSPPAGTLPGILRCCPPRPPPCLPAPCPYKGTGTAPRGGLLAPARGHGEPWPPHGTPRCPRHPALLPGPRCSSAVPVPSWAPSAMARPPAAQSQGCWHPRGPPVAERAGMGTRQLWDGTHLSGHTARISVECLALDVPLGIEQPLLGTGRAGRWMLRARGRQCPRSLTRPVLPQVSHPPQSWPTRARHTA